MTAGDGALRTLAEALLADFTAALRRAAGALASEDDAAFEVAMGESEAVRAELAPCLDALAGTPAPALVRLLREASEEHARLAALAAARRDRLAGVLAGMHRPDPVAAAYGIGRGPTLSIRS